MSEHIVHTAVLEDTFRIAGGLPGIPESFREVMRDFEAFAQLGCITVSGDTFSFRLLEEYKPLWAGRDELLKAKTAFVLGWVSHRACDREMKPIWREPKLKGRGSDVDPNLSPTECSVYHEGVMFNRYYANDPKFRLAVYPQELAQVPGSDYIDLDRAALFIQQAFGASYMNIQTLPEDADPQTFFEEMCMRAQKFYVDAEVLCGPPTVHPLGGKPGPGADRGICHRNQLGGRQRPDCPAGPPSAGRGVALAR